MSDQYAKPGDTILVNDDDSIHHSIRGKQFTVIECPDRWAGSAYDIEGTAWFNYEAMDRCIDIDTYSIIGTSRSSSTCVPSSVDERLKKKRDDNLSGVFG